MSDKVRWDCFPDPQPEHSGGIIDWSFGDEIAYAGICKCGWKSEYLRHEEMAALDDFAEHISQIIDFKIKNEKRPNHAR